MTAARRSRIELLLDTLDVINREEFKPTNIMYKAGLSYKLLNQLLETLASEGLIVKRKPSVSKRGRRLDKRIKREYYITEKGADILRKGASIQELVKVAFKKHD